LRLVQFGAQSRDTEEVCGIAVVVGMVLQKMPFTHDLRGNFRMCRDALADTEKCGPNASFTKQLQQDWCRAFVGPIIESQRDTLPVSLPRTNEWTKQLQLRESDAKTDDSYQSERYCDTQRNAVQCHCQSAKRHTGSNDKMEPRQSHLGQLNLRFDERDRFSAARRKRV
jgi:hypothetical protein